MKSIGLRFLLMGLVSLNSQANLIVNGDFEDTSLTNGLNWQVFNSIVGWRTTEGPGIEIQHNLIFTAQSGSQYVELDSDKKVQGGTIGNSAMSQNIDTVNGESYLLSFYYRPRGYTVDDSNMEVHWADISQDTEIEFGDSTLVGLIEKETEKSINEWMLYTMRLDASSDQMGLSFRGTGIDNSFGALIDNVSLVKVSAPGSLALFGLGLAGMAVLRRSH